MITRSQKMLARLMATEKIGVRSSNVETAHFNLKTREVVVPNWKDIGEALSLRFISHEVSHALHTEGKGWHDSITEIGPRFRKYLNVVEDARIEKLIQKKYPGLKRDYFNSNKELIERGFFGKLKNINSAAFIDRINVHTKLGLMSTVKFSPEEQTWVDEIEALETWEETEALTRRLYKYCALHENKSEQDDIFEPPKSPGNSSEETSSDPSDDTREDEESTGDDSTSSSDESGDESGEGEESSGSSSDESGEGEESSGSSGDESGDVSDEELKNLPEPSDCETEDAYRETLDNLEIERTDNFTSNMHHPEDYRDHFCDNKKFLSYARAVFSRNDKIISGLKERSKSFVSYAVSQFEKKKAAADSKRTAVSKTGRIDPLKLSQYKFTDDIFLSRNVVRDGKNHGFIILLDWSSSMNSRIRPITEHMYKLTTFCKRVGIPYKVILFGIDARRTVYDFKFLPVDNEARTDLIVGSADCFRTPFGVVEVLNSEMSKSDYESVVSLLFSFEGHSETNKSKKGLLEMGGTPLVEALMTLMPIAERFKGSSKVEVLNTVIITDGQADPMRSSIPAEGCPVMDACINIHNCWFDLQHPITKEYYSLVEYGEVPLVAYQMYKDFTGSNVIDYFLSGSNIKLPSPIWRKIPKEECNEAEKFFKKYGYYSFDKKGCDMAFVIVYKTNENLAFDEKNHGSVEDIFMREQANKKAIRRMTDDITDVITKNVT